MPITMPNQLNVIFEQIIQEGKKQQLTQKDICRKAGIDESTLSRAKKAGDMRYSSLEKLANAVGLKLSLITDDALIELIDSGDLFE